MTTRRIAACCGAGLPLGNAKTNNKQVPRKAGMCMSASAGGSLRRNGVPTGLLLARAAAVHRHDAGGGNVANNKGAT